MNINQLNYFEWYRCHFVHLLRLYQHLFSSQLEISHVLNGTTPEFSFLSILFQKFSLNPLSEQDFNTKHFQTKYIVLIYISNIRMSAKEHLLWCRLQSSVFKVIIDSPAVGDFFGTGIEILSDCTGPKLIFNIQFQQYDNSKFKL